MVLTRQAEIPNDCRPAEDQSIVVDSDVGLLDIPIPKLFVDGKLSFYSQVPQDYYRDLRNKKRVVLRNHPLVQEDLPREFGAAIVRFVLESISIG